MTSTAEQRYRLGEVGGVRVVTERVPSVGSVSLAVWIGTGSRDEAGVHGGYAHFVEHLVFKGNETRDAAAISRWFDSIGSDANAATTREYTVVSTRALARHVPDALDVIGEMVWRPAFAPADVEAERQVILEEIAMYADSPADVVHELGDLLVFGDHPLGRPILGSESSVADAGASDIAVFHAAAYRPGQVVVSAAGALDHDEILALVEERFLRDPATRRGDATASGQAAATAAVERERPGFASGAAVQVKDTEQVHVCLCWPGLSRTDPRRFAGAVLDTLLGATPGSRLFLEVREHRGLAYSVYSFATQYSDAGQAGVYLGVRPDRLREALQVLRTEVERACIELPSDEEVRRAQDHLEGRMLLAMESTSVRGNRLGSALVTGTPIEPVSSVVERIRAATPAQVRELAAEVLDAAAMSIAAVAEDGDQVADAIADVFGVRAEVREEPPVPGGVVGLRR